MNGLDILTCRGRLMSRFDVFCSVASLPHSKPKCKLQSHVTVYYQLRTKASTGCCQKCHDVGVGDDKVAVVGWTSSQPVIQFLLITIPNLKMLFTTLRASQRRSYATVSSVNVAAINRGQPTSSVSIVVKAGPRYESKPGVAHCLKNFAFKVSSNINAEVRLISYVAMGTWGRIQRRGQP